MAISQMHHVLIPKRCGNIREVPSKKRRGPLEGPRRRDIAPTGELAGLPARNSPKLLFDLGCHRKAATSYCQKLPDEQRTLYKPSSNNFHLTRSAQDFGLPSFRASERPMQSSPMVRGGGNDQSSAAYSLPF
jgi:hypothetical protein